LNTSWFLIKKTSPFFVYQYVVQFQSREGTNGKSGKTEVTMCFAHVTRGSAG